MFLTKLLNADSRPALEQTLQFTAARHKLLAENIANIDTPDYKQKDLSVERFHSMMQQRLENGQPLDDMESQVTNPTDGILFHDGNNRSPEQLMSEFAKNALLHNMAVEMLRKQYAQMDMALKEKAG